MAVGCLGGAPWCVGAVYPAPQLLTSTAALPLGPLFFEQIGEPQHLFSTGCYPPRLLDDHSSGVSTQQHGEKNALKHAETTSVPDLHVQDDNNALRSAKLYNNSQVLGNRLQCLKCSRDGNVCVFFTTGQNADVIASVSCSVGLDGAWNLHNNHGMHAMTHGPISHQLPQNGCTTSPPLGHPIVQLSAIRKSKWDTNCASLLAARSSFMVQFIGTSREDTDTEFTTPIVTTFESQPSHVSWNPHMPWEAAVVLETGEVRLFDIQSTGSSSSKASSLNLTAKHTYKPAKTAPLITASSATTHSDRKVNLELINSEQSNSANLVSAPALQWWECEFTWHPKALLLAGTKEVSLLDFRIKHADSHAQVTSQQLVMGEMGENCNTSIVARVPGTGNTPGYSKRSSGNNIFLSFARATYDGMCQFVTATKQHLVLFDIRRPQIPVLQWEHGMVTEPPGLLLMCPLSELRPNLQQPDTCASTTGKAILAASLQSGDMLAFCYGSGPPVSLPLQGTTVRNNLDLDEKLYAWQLPSKMFLPKATPNDWTDTLRSSMNFFQEDNRNRSAKGASKGRVRENIAGLVVVPSDIPHIGGDHLGQKRDREARRGFSMVQFTGVGDMLVQQFQASKRLPRSKSQVPAEQKRDAHVPPESPELPRRTFNLRKLPFALSCIIVTRAFDIQTGSALGCNGDSTGLKRKNPFFLDERLVKDRDDWKQECLLNNDDEGAVARKASFMEEAGAHKRSLIEWKKGLPIEEQQLQKLVEEIVQQSKVPLTLYEVAHKALRSSLPTDLASLAAGMPAHVTHLHYRNYLPTILADHLQQQILTKRETGKDEFLAEDPLQPIDSASGLKSKEFPIPLPFLLEVDGHQTRQSVSEGHLNQGSEKQEEERKHSGQVYKLGSEVDLGSGHDVLLSMCGHVGSLVERLAQERRSQPDATAISLDDAVEMWQGTPAKKEEHDRFQLVHYRNPNKKYKVSSSDWYSKPFLGPSIMEQALPSAVASLNDKFNSCVNLSSQLETAEPGRSQSTSEEQQQTSAFERAAFSPFACGLAKSSSSDDESQFRYQQGHQEESELCPIQLPFHSPVKELEPEEMDATSSLKTQFKRWQQLVVPYTTFCKDDLC